MKWHISPPRKECLIHLHRSILDQVKILSKQFQSAFSERCDIDKDEFNKTCQLEGQFPTALDPVINSTGILKLLKGLNPNKASGPDNICRKILRELADQIAPILTIIFQTSLDSGDVTEDWRTVQRESSVCASFSVKMAS